MALALKAEPPPPTPHYDAGDEQARLLEILERTNRLMLAAVNALVASNFDIDPRTFRVDDATTRRILQAAATRVVRIDDTTRQTIAATLQEGQARGYSNWQLAHGVPADNYPGIDGLFRERWKNRPDMVARTELQQAQRDSAVESYLATGLVDRVRIIDGCLWDDKCCKRNDTVVPIEQAPTLNHPNCTLVLVPVMREGVVPKPLPQWGQWQTVAEAEQAATARYSNIQFDFTGAVLETVDPTLRQFDRLAKDYPQVADRLTYLGTYGGPTAPPLPDGWEPNTWAHATRNGKIIGLNPAWYGDPAKFRDSLRTSEAAKWHPKSNDSIESVITHEFGHQVENWFRSIDAKIAAFDVVDISGNGLVSATFDRWYQAHHTTRALSEYALKSSEEGWAEAFAANYHAPATVRRLAYVKNQRELLKALDPSEWRHEQGLADTVATLEQAVQAIEPGTPAHRLTSQALEAARRRLDLSPGGEWQWTRDLPQEERQSARARLNQWMRGFDL